MVYVDLLVFLNSTFVEFQKKLLRASKKNEK